MSDETVHPYVGIRPFNSDENLFFFGRDEQTLEILQRLHENHFVAVVGGSGSGKSSLIRAGLIPALKGGYLVEDSNKWLIAIMKPGQNPMYNLAKAVLLQVDPETAHSDVLDFIKRLKKEGVKAIIQLIEPLQKEENINFFLLIDQFEELFRFAMDQKDASRKTEAFDFVNMMLSLAMQTEAPFYIVLTMRSDFIGDCAQFHDLPEALNKSQYLVPRLNRQQLKMVIEGPAKLFGGKFSPALTSQLLNDLGNVKDELPLMQHALMRIWDYEMVVDKSGELDLRDYRAIGGFEKALDIHADEALNGLSEANREIAKILFQALTEIDENRRKIRRPLLLKDLKELTGVTEEKLLDVIDHFIRDMRAFLILERSGEKGDLLIDISHESLIRQWDTLNHWVDEESESAIAYKKLAEDTRLFLLKKKDLLTGSELQLALEWREKFNPTAVWANRYSGGTFKDCMHYLKASENERRRSKILERERRKKLRYLWAALGGLLVIFTVIIYIKMKESQELTEKAQTSNLESGFFRNAYEDPTLALKLLQQTISDKATTSKIEEEELLKIKEVAEKIYHNNSFYKIIVHDSTKMLSAAISPNGKIILTGSQDSTARLWDLEGNMLREFKEHNGAVNTVTFSPDGKTLLTGSDDHTARLWDLEGNMLRKFKGHKGAVYSVAFSPDSVHILTGSKDKSAILWNLKGDTLQRFKEHNSAVYSVAFSPDGKTIVTAYEDRTARLWDLSGKQLEKFDGHTGPIYSIAFSPDGKTILTGSEDFTARLWDLKGNELRSFDGHSGAIYSVAFSSPDGRHIITGSEDKTVRLWQLDGNLLQTIIGHSGPVRSVTSPDDGNTILTGSSDRTARLWRLKLELDQIYIGHKGAIKSVAFSPDSVHILTGSEDHTARLWNLKTGEMLQQFGDVERKRMSNGHKGTVYSVAFSPDSVHILTGSKDKSAILWNLKGDTLQSFKGHTGAIYSVAFSPNGQKIVTASNDGTARLWDLNGKILHEFEEHTSAVNSIAFSPDGQKIVTASYDKTARIWDINGKPLQEFNTYPITTVAFSPDGKTILTGSEEDQTARLWNLKGDTLQSFKGHTAAISSVAFSPVGPDNKCKYILTGSYDRTARLWDLETGAMLQEFIGHKSLVNSVTFSPDGSTVLTGSYDRTARLWKIAIPLEDFLEMDWGEPLSPEQKSEYEIVK